MAVCSKYTSNNGICFNGKDWTGVHSSLEVLSLDKQHGMKGKQITAGQLTGTKQGITMQYQIKRSYEIRLGNTIIYIDAIQLHLATTWTHSPRWNYSCIIPEKKASRMISPP